MWDLQVKRTTHTHKYITNNVFKKFRFENSSSLEEGYNNIDPGQHQVGPTRCRLLLPSYEGQQFCVRVWSNPLYSDNKPVQGSISEKAEQVFQNVKNILAESNSSLDNIVKVNVFLADMKNFAEFNSVYAKHFHTHKPARSCVGVASLPLNVDLEMEVIAVEKNWRIETSLPPFFHLRYRGVYIYKHFSSIL